MPVSVGSATEMDPASPLAEACSCNLPRMLTSGAIQGHLWKNATSVHQVPLRHYFHGSGNKGYSDYIRMEQSDPLSSRSDTVF